VFRVRSARQVHECSPCVRSTLGENTKERATIGGGDIQCDNLIQNLSFQDPAGNLEAWLKSDAPEAEKLDLSSSFNPQTGKPYSYAEYSSAMIALLESFKKYPDINCVSPGDKSYPVDINDTSKICVTSVDNSGVHMKCDRTLFMGLSPDEQIEQDHHEFAINIPGLEPDMGSISTYKISTQLADSIQTVSERRLAVNFSASSESEVQYSQMVCNEYFWTPTDNGSQSGTTESVPLTTQSDGYWHADLSKTLKMKGQTVIMKAHGAVNGLPYIDVSYTVQPSGMVIGTNDELPRSQIELAASISGYRAYVSCELK
jgi:hypothetical protein